MNINEIREYLTKISPQSMFGDETEGRLVERKLSDERPRCVDFFEAVSGEIYADIYTETVFDALLHIIPVVTRQMLDEVVHWEETGDAPEWFPKEFRK